MSTYRNIFDGTCVNNFSITAALLILMLVLFSESTFFMRVGVFLLIGHISRSCTFIIHKFHPLPGISVAVKGQSPQDGQNTNSGSDISQGSGHSRQLFMRLLD